MNIIVDENFRVKLRVELAKARLTQRALAKRMKVPDTTFSDWVTGAHPAPPGFLARVEQELGLPAGSFT